MEFYSLLLICFFFFVIAFLYSSIGHGGASGYLAVLSLLTFTPEEMASTALLLNVIVAGIAFSSYYHSGYFSIRFSIPFVLTSIPLAFIGGSVHIPPIYYSILLSFALIAAAIRLIVRIESGQAEIRNPTLKSLTITLPLGGFIGFISGMVGIGGGIFLSPIILLMNWADPKYTAATAAFFVVVNSISGILGRVIQGNFTTGFFYPYLLSAICGGIAGSLWGAKKITGVTIRRILGFALLVPAVKLLVSAL